MDDPSTLRKKAARYFENAASSPTADDAEKLNEVGRQLELWADDLEEMKRRESSTRFQVEAGAEGSETEL
jgi:hypothetical protein